MPADFSTRHRHRALCDKELLMQHALIPMEPALAGLLAPMAWRMR
ncbi:hypothetical protein [Streptomyces aidingensis]|nr:hypothetical protein [Streptomyces aidingensis]